MAGGFRLLCIFAGLAVTMMVAIAWAGDGSSASTTPAAGPPKVKVDVVEETLHGHKIADPYRWLEDASSADSQEYVRQELAYTRSILDPLPGRDRSISGCRSFFPSAQSARRRSADPSISIRGAKARRTSRCYWFVKACVAKTAFWLIPINYPPTARLPWTGGFPRMMASTWLTALQPAAPKTAPCT